MLYKIKIQKRQIYIYVQFVTSVLSSPLQGGLSVDSISDLVESQSRLLEALQLSHPAELELKKSPGGRSSEGRTQTKLSLNPIYRQVPRVLERCCSHIETYGEPQVGFHVCHLEFLTTNCKWKFLCSSSTLMYSVDFHTIFCVHTSADKV